MATTTTNFGWDIPQSTDLVKDGATAIATLGQDIDTAFVDLKGGTTGQVLSKASGTDLDFTWVAQDDSNAIQNAIVDAKGDLIAATAADTPARLAVGTNGQVLTADSAAATGLKWATAATGKVLQIVTAITSTKTTTSSTSYVDVTGLTATITPTSASSKILVLVNNPIYYSGAVKGPGMSEQLVRGATALFDFPNIFIYGDAWTGSNAFGSPVSIMYVDSPATTSATTYKVQVKALASTAVEINASAGEESTITLLEITV